MVTMPGVVGATARRQGRSKIARGVPMKKFVDQYGFFGHATVLIGNQLYRRENELLDQVMISVKKIKSAIAHW